MTKWYVKDLSKLTKVSVQTLHHYDRINLLKPSVRLANSYRLYSEVDLLKLQQIIALKFFGFELSKIKDLLKEEIDVREHFAAQSQFLEQKANSLLEANKTLKSIISDCGSKSIPWETIIKLIEVYNMTNELEKTWVGKALSKEELKQYASFEQGLKTRFTPSEKKSFEQAWAELVAQIAANLDKDPTSDFGVNIGKNCMDMINNLYGNEHANLRSAVWDKGFKAGKMDDNHGLSPEMVSWLDKAIETFNRRRAYSILSQLDTAPKLAQKLWDEFVTDMCGDSQTKKTELLQIAQADGNIEKSAKNWLKKTYQ